MQRERSIFLLALVLMSIVGCVSIYYATNWGPWAMSDGAGYIMNARSLRQGLGLTLPSPSGGGGLTTHMPPLYMLTLAVMGDETHELVQGARWLGIVSFGLMISMTGAVIFSLTNDRSLAIASSVLLLTFPDLINFYSAIMSETQFLLFGFASIFLVLLYQKRRAPMLYILSALFAGFATITRYIGITFVITSTVIYYLFDGSPHSKKLLRAIAFLLLALLPLLLWQVVIALHPTAEPARLINISLADLWQRMEPIRGAYVDMAWKLIPFIELGSPVPYLVRLAVVSALMIVFLWAIWSLVRRKPGAGETDDEAKSWKSVLSALLIFFFVYLAVIAGSYLFTQPPPDLSSRILFPPIVVLTLLFILVIFRLTRVHLRSKRLLLLPWMAVIVIIADHLPETISLMQKLHQSGRGYTGKEWRSSALLGEVGAISEDIPIISNDPVAIQFYYGRGVYYMPEILPGNADLEIRRYGEHPELEAHVAFKEGGGALVVFNSIYWQMHPVFDDRTDEMIEKMTKGLDLEVDTWDGSIFYYPDTH